MTFPQKSQLKWYLARKILASLPQGKERVKMALKIISLKKQETAQPIKVETQDEIVTQPEGGHPEAALGDSR